MACVTEAIGMSVPGCATALAVSGKKRRIAFESGALVCDLIRQNVTPRKMMTKKGFENAVRIDLAWEAPPTRRYIFRPSPTTQV